MENTVIESRAAKYLFNGKGALRHIRSMFQQTDVSSHERRRCKSKYLPEREIPRHDSEDRAERLIVNITAGRVGLCRLVLKEPLRVVGVKSTAARTFLNLFQGRTEQLSHFERDDFGEPVFFQ